MTNLTLPKTLLGLLLPLLFLALLPGLALAQGPDDQVHVVDWHELKTDKFVIVYAEKVEANDQAIPCACGIGQAEKYAAFIDTIYGDLAKIFAVELKTPIDLRLFPTEESYYEVNPLARHLTGVIAHANNNREEIAIAVPRTERLTDEELVNNLRHEMTHLFASQLSDGRLKAGFQEGIAQYLEKPTGTAQFNPALLGQALEQERLLTWAELDRAEQVYSDPQVAYPQTLSVVSFLVDRYGLPALLDFIEAAAREPGYRSALETAYGKPADELESEWLAYLPEYLEERWQINAIYYYDLSRLRQLVARGAYSSVETELAEVVALLETTNQADTLAEAEALLAQARQGQAAGALADETRAALEAGDYWQVVKKGNAAIAAYEEVGYRQRIPEIQVYIHRAELGQSALDRLNSGARMLEALRFAEAESQIYEATVLLQSLNNQNAAQLGTALLTESAQRQRLLAYVLMGVGLTLLLFNGLRRIINRLSAEPLEVEFT